MVENRRKTDIKIVEQRVRSNEEPILRELLDAAIIFTTIVVNSSIFPEEPLYVYYTVQQISTFSLSRDIQ